MANRVIFRYYEEDEGGEIITEGWHNILRVERSAGGPPTVLVTIEDWDNGLKCGEATVTVRNPRMLIEALTEWVKDR